MWVNLCEHCRTSFAEYVPHDGKRVLLEDGYNKKEWCCPPKLSCPCCQSISEPYSKEEKDHCARDYGRHTCQTCGLSLFLCLKCASDIFHYCAEQECEACFCVSCDGGVNLTAALEAYEDGEGDGAVWEGLQANGTAHFKLVNCANDGCSMPPTGR
jgi:hypothetical protein